MSIHEEPIEADPQPIIELEPVVDLKSESEVPYAEIVGTEVPQEVYK